MDTLLMQTAQWIGLLLTLFILLYLVIGDNALFRIVTYTVIGVASGYVFVLTLVQVLIPRFINLFDTVMRSGEPLFLIIGLIPFLLGVLLLIGKIVPGANALGTVPMGILVGIGAAVAVGGAIFGTLFGQIDGTLATIPSFGELIAASDSNSPITSPFSRLAQGLFTVIGMVCTLAYFQFSVRSRNTNVAAEEVTNARRAVSVEMLAKVGQIFIGITLGAVFAGVYTAAISAFVERIGSVFDAISLALAQLF